MDDEETVEDGDSSSSEEEMPSDLSSSSTLFELQGPPLHHAGHPVVGAGQDPEETAGDRGADV